MSDLVCCGFCGRDTRNQSHVCNKCMRGISKHDPRRDKDAMELDDGPDCVEDMMAIAVTRMCGDEPDWW